MTRDDERRKLAELAIGRIFGMLQRPYRQGDDDEYARCRAIILDASDGIDATDRRPNWARDRLKGAPGD